MSTILIVDDDAGVLAAFEDLLVREGHQVETANTGETAISLIHKKTPDLVIMDIRLPGLNGLEVFQQIRGIAPKLPVIMMTGYSSMETAIEATKLGAYDYQLKPLDPETMMKAIAGALECVRLMQQEVALDVDTEEFTIRDTLVGHSQVMREVFKQIGRVAPTDATVLIRGETGTGKELVARTIYQHSRRYNQPLVIINCAAIPETLLESELFGHERGAFTGADHRRIGKFEQAQGGTLFLDEVGDLPIGVQAKLLRVLQDGVVERLGGGTPQQVDVRIIAATNRDLEVAQGEGLFREDLFHRLQVFTIRLPALRERAEDIPRLVRYFLQRLASELGCEVPMLTESALAMLQKHTWPGNVRELQHAIHRALILSGGYPLQEETLRQALAGDADPSSKPDLFFYEQSLRDLARQAVAAGPGQQLFAQFTEAAEKALLQEALQVSGGNQSQAARLLGIPRPTLKSKLDKYAIPVTSEPVQDLSEF